MNIQNLNMTERRIIFHILSLIMKADQIIDPAEVEFLDKVFFDYELDISEFDHMEDLTTEELSKAFTILSDDKKEYAKKLFFEMAACDGYIDPREIEIINQMFK